MDNIVDLTKFKKEETQDSSDDYLMDGLHELCHHLNLCDGFVALTFNNDVETANVIIAGEIEPSEAIEAFRYVDNFFTKADKED